MARLYVERANAKREKEKEMQFYLFTKQVQCLHNVLNCNVKAAIVPLPLVVV